MSLKRSVLKTITWRITATTTTLLMVYMISGEIAVAGSVAITEIFLKTLIYYFHERAWEKVTLNKVDTFSQEMASTIDKSD